jgi:pullulanase
MNRILPDALFRWAAVTALLVTIFSPLAVNRALADETPNPQSVTIAGTLQSEVGCPSDWQPACDKTFLTYSTEDDVWQGAFNVEPANDQDKKGPRYKAALNGAWTENYGLNASVGGADIPLVVSQTTLVKFYYDHKTHWIADDFNNLIITATGDFQTALGCSANDDPTCLRGWLQDPDGDKLYTFVTTIIPPGTYSIQLAFKESLEGATPGQIFEVKTAGQEIYFGYNAETKEMTVSTDGAPHGSLAKARAQWVTRDTILWNVVGSPKYSYSLYYSRDATLALSAEGVTGGTEVSLTFANTGPGGDVFTKFPYLAGYSAFKLDPAEVASVPEILKGQVALVARDDTGKVVDATSPQIPGVLDDLFHYTGPLGITWDGPTPTLRVWAPTAKTVAVQIFDTSTAPNFTTVPMTYDSTSGVWLVTGTADWKNKFYLYAVDVYVPKTGKVEHNVTTDPYSLSLSLESQRSQLVDLNDPALKPEGWDTLGKPALAAPEDSVVYELHIRDFSLHDATVPEALRGTYAAFTVAASDGMKHLKALADAGLTHIHLLPAFDLASIEEDKSQWESVPDLELAAFPPDSDQQQLLLGPTREKDGFNWGYDPYHYTVPEGSYSTQPDGSARIKEFRAMVAALNQSGLRIVMDVVYNHTTASGQADQSVLDKIVPGYYYRLNTEGEVETSTCCQNTASEHYMMEKLLIDSVLTWATAYKVDGFRFDLMGHHMLSSMENLRTALNALTPQQGGVDGQAIYVYGEGWNFGEVINNARGVNASQQNIGGSGLGVFNDRLRDGVRGGNPFDPPTLQGFATGLFTQPNSAETRSESDQKDKLLEYEDWIKAGLAGNLTDFKFVNANGDLKLAQNIYYGGDPVGYTKDPQENVVYVSAHDNQTIFDAVQVKAAAQALLADRVRMNNLALDLVMLSQGVPFFHAGDDLLRSKSFDPNSYNSGDWFNKLDFSMQTNNWGVGLPFDSESNWPLYGPLLANPALKPGAADIAGASQHFQQMLRVRKSSPLFRLQTADQVERTLSFLNGGPSQVPGLIVMQLTDVDALDPNYDQILVFFNANPDAAAFADGSLQGLALQPYGPLFFNSDDPALRDAKFDSATGAFTIPGRTTVVYGLAESGKYQPLLTATATTLATATSVPAPTSAPTATLIPTLALIATLTPALLPTPVSAQPWVTSAPAIVGLGVILFAVVAGWLIWRRRQ